MLPHPKKRKSFVLVLFLLAIVIVSGVIFSNVLFYLSEIETTKYLLQSPPAFYAADSGAERILYKVLVEKAPLSEIQEKGTLDNGAEFSLSVESAEGYVKFISKGTYKNAHRSIELSY